MKKGVWFLFLAIGGCGVPTLFTDIPSAAGQLPAEYAKSEKLGLPLTSAELLKDIPEWEPHQVAVVKAFVDRQNATQRMLPGVAAYTEIDDWKAAARYFTMNGETMALAEKISRLPNGRMPRNYDMGVNVLFPEYACFKTAAKLLSARATVRAHLGDVSGTIQDLRDARGIARIANCEPTLISALVSIASESIANRAIQQVTEIWKSNPSALAQLERSVRDLPRIVSLSHSLKGEVFLGTTSGRNMDLFGGLKQFTNTIDG